MIIGCIMVAILSILWFNKAFGDYIPYIGVRVEDSSPMACIFEPANKKINFTSRDLLNTTKQSIQDWEDRLENKTDGNWHIETKYFAYLEHRDKEAEDYPQCNIYIVYNQTFSGKYAGALGITSYDYSHSKHKYSFIQVTTSVNDLSIKLSPLTKNNNITISVTSLTSRQLDSRIIGQVIKHEFGHALGLDHYIATKGGIIRPDLMKTTMNERIFVPSFDITDNDLDAIIHLYGKDGFGGRQPIIPRNHFIG